MEILLNNSKIRMRNVQTVERKLKSLIETGKNNLLVISDFDYTLSRYHDEQGNSCWTTYGVFDVAAATVSSTLSAEFERLKAKYLPIELDPHMSMVEKTPHMVRWWKTAHKHIVEAGFTQQSIKNFVYNAKLELRDQAQKMILELHDHHVPLIIFSAGVGNVISLFLAKIFQDIPDNVHIISNMMEFDANGVVSGFKKPLIHTFNKNSSVAEKKGPLFEEIRTRKAVILLGDGLGDLQMDVGVENEQVALKIGFLNFENDALLEKYLDGYDIVLLDDQTMQIPRFIIKQITNSHHQSNDHAEEHNLCNH